MNNKAKRPHIFFGQNPTKTDTVLFDDYGWGVWYVLIMVKVFLCVFLCTNISSHPKDIWELIKPKSWRGGEGGGVAFLLLCLSMKVFSTLFHFHKKWTKFLFVNLYYANKKVDKLQILLIFLIILKIPDEMLSHLVDFLRHTLNNFCMVFNSKVVMWNFLYKR